MINQGTCFAKESGFELYIVAGITLTIIVIFVCIIDKEDYNMHSAPTEIGYRQTPSVVEHVRILYGQSQQGIVKLLPHFHYLQ